MCPRDRIPADKQVRCPFCGSEIHLGSCPIVRTAGDDAPRSSSAAEETGERGGRGGVEALGEVLSSAEAPPASETVEPGQVTRGRRIRSTIDGNWRMVVAPASGDRHLTPPDEIAKAHGLTGIRPARACPVCFHPLPRRIDTEPQYVVILLGQRASAKTATVLSIVEHGSEGGLHFAARRNGAIRRAYVIESEEVREYLEARDPRIFDKFRAREPLQRTQARRRHPPLEFSVTLESGESFGLHFIDLAGEDYDRAVRPQRVSALRWAHAVVFFVDPAPAFDPENADPESEVGRAGALLRGVIDDLGEADHQQHLFVVVPKADVLPKKMELTREIVEDVGNYPPGRVQQVVEDCGAVNVVGAAQSWPGGSRHVRWHFLAPMPPNDKPWGIKPLIDQILSSLPPTP